MDYRLFLRVFLENEMIFFRENSYNSVYKLFVVHIACEEPEIFYFLMYLLYFCLRIQSPDFVWKRLISGVNTSHFHFSPGNEHFYISFFVSFAKMHELSSLSRCTICYEDVTDLCLNSISFQIELLCNCIYFQVYRWKSVSFFFYRTIEI